MKTSAKTARASRKCSLKSLALGLIVASGLALTADPASAALQFTGSGFNPETGHTGQSAEADISLVGSTLTLTLRNTSGLTPAQGDALTGILFDLSTTASLKLQAVTLAPGGHIWTSGSKTYDSKKLAGSWTDALADVPRLAADYGLATTGFNGEFKAGTISTGNASSDYGIVGADTLPGTFSGARYPVAENALSFNIKVTSGVLSESDIAGVRFLFGTDGRGVVQGSLVPVGDGNPGGGNVPEPASFALLAIALAAARIARGRAV